MNLTRVVGLTLLTMSTRTQYVRYLFTDKVLMHLTKTGVSTAMDWPAMNVVAVQVHLEDEDRDIGQRTEVDKLLNLMLKEPLVDQHHKYPLRKPYQQSSA